MKRAYCKAERLNKIQLLLSSVQDGLTRTELSHRIGVSKATISRDVVELSIECPIHEEERTGKLSIDKISILTNLYFDVPEIQALHLACRLLGRKVKFHYPSASSALRKIGKALNNYAEPIASAITSTAELFEYHNYKNSHHYAEIVKVITEGIMKGLSVSFERFSRREDCWKFCLFSSYCIEPYAEGNSLYLIGLEEGVSALRTIKFELIKNVQLTDKPYCIPNSFSSDLYFKDSWGIWTTEDDLSEVVLVFSARVKQRVLQTEWHLSEHIDVIDDGTLKWTAQIAQPLEMLPWIRGWGSDVEVIKPDRLRKMIVDDILASSKNYGLQVLSKSEKDK